MCNKFAFLCPFVFFLHVVKASYFSKGKDILGRRREKSFQYEKCNENKCDNANL